MTTVTVILHVYEDEIKQYALDELNEYLSTDVEVQDIELSLFHDFPYASLEFKKVFIADAFKEHENLDTLLFANRMYFNFNVLDIWNENYEVKRVSIHDGQINLRTTSSGDVNYDIVVPKSDTIPSENDFSFELELLRAENMKFGYFNKSTAQFYSISVLDGLFSGDFTEDKYELKTESALYVHQIKSNSFRLLQNKRAKLDLSLDIDNENGLYTFKQGDLLIEKMPFSVLGWISDEEMDLSISGENISVDQLANSLVDETLQEAQLYKGEGILDFAARIKGALSKSEMPSVEAEFHLESGSLTEPESKLTLSQINLNGIYENAQKNREEKLVFDEVSFKMLNSNFSGNASVVNFSQPIVSTSAKGHVDLGALHTFFRFQNVQTLKGAIDIDFQGVIQFFDPEYRADKFEVRDAKGVFQLHEVAYQGGADDLSYSSINGELVVNGKDAAADNLSIRTTNSDVLVSGALQNFIPYIEGNGSLGLVATIESSRLDLNEFIGDESVVDETAPPEMFQLPGDLNINADLNIGELIWEDHSFKKISGALMMANQKVTINNFKLHTLEGTAYGNIALNNLMEGGNVIEGNINFYGINIKQAFKEWKEFDQNTITSEHLSGKAKGGVDLLLFFNPYMSIIEDKMYVVTDITIQEGAIVNLELMKEITAYMRSNKGLKLLLNNHIDDFESRLLNIRFTDLTNRIEIKDRKIFIPRMKISSSAMDMDLFGWHDFDNNIEYHFSFRFRELKSQPAENEFGTITDDGLGLVIYLTMSGNIDDPIYELDRQERMNQLKDDLAEEKSTMKSILKSEFGLFKKDSTIQTMKERNVNQVSFIYYEEDIEDVDAPADTTRQGKNKGRTRSFFDKLKEESQRDSVKYQND